MRTAFLVPVLVAAGFVAGPAFAQTITPPTGDFEGVRIEGKVGGHRFQAYGNHDDRWAWGGTVGYDTHMGNFVVGAEGSYIDTRGVVCRPNIVDDDCTRPSREITAAIRGGLQFSARSLVYVKAGYANERQRRTVDVGGTRVFSDREVKHGYHLGGGFEYILASRIYASGEIRYSNYTNNTSQVMILGGVGVRF